MRDIQELAKRLEQEISTLPIGYISKKKINGKIQHYHQWAENGKVKSKYIKSGELEDLESKINYRRELQEKLKEINAMLPKNMPSQNVYETNVITGKNLLDMVQNVKPYKKRDCFSQIQDYIYGNDYTRVCVVYGLRRTGKTTMLFQTLSEMSHEDLSRSAYVKLRKADTIAQINRDMYKLKDGGYKFIFIDEATLVSDFIDSASLFSDIFVPMGMRIVLSGTDSLGFWLAEHNELYDRARMIHTTFIPYKEYSRLLNIDSIDEYIRYGGTLRAGELEFDTVIDDDASFRDDESTRKYIDTAISRNIQHSLACYEDGGHFRHLISLYDAGELTNAINRIIQDMNHRFVEKVITRDFKSSDLRTTAGNLRKEKDEEKRNIILDTVDQKAITKRLMDILEIKNKCDQTIDITPAHVYEIKGYLSALDLIQNCPIEYEQKIPGESEHVIFSQPGMRYCQAQALVHSLMKDSIFNMLEPEKKEYVSNRILEQVRGRMLEDIVLLETSKELGREYDVFKLEFARGEFDMVVRNKNTNTCSIYEVKHSSVVVKEQANHLLNEEECNLTEKRFGKIVGKYVIYLGNDSTTDYGIQYLNAERFLKSIPKQIALSMDDGFVEEQSQDGNDFGMTMM